jgi:hypothetical protein
LAKAGTCYTNYEDRIKYFLHVCNMFISLYSSYRVAIDYSEYSGNCLDIYESFSEGKCLENVFMQCFIECVRDDSKNHRRTMTSNRLILDVNVGVCSSSQLL